MMTGGVEIEDGSRLARYLLAQGNVFVDLKRPSFNIIKIQDETISSQRYIMYRMEVGPNKIESILNVVTPTGDSGIRNIATRSVEGNISISTDASCEEMHIGIDCMFAYHETIAMWKWGGIQAE